MSIKDFKKIERKSNRAALALGKSKKFQKIEDKKKPASGQISLIKNLKKIISETFHTQAKIETFLTSFFEKVLPRRLRFFILISSIVIFSSYQISPIFMVDHVKAEMHQLEEFKALRDKANEHSDDRYSSSEFIEIFDKDINFLISFNASFLARPWANSQRQPMEITETLQIRWDRLFLLLGGTVLLVGSFFVARSSSKLNVSSSTEKPWSKWLGVLSRAKASTTVELFAAEVSLASDRASDLNSKSTYMLIGGILMAFAGVVIFYTSLPDAEKVQSFDAYWQKTIRPIGILIFIESIAWFLLRQYRSLIEDYKWFYRSYLKRTNYLSALRILQVKEIRPEDMFVVVSLVQEDFSGRLKPGETTESLESLKQPESGPITEILKAVGSLKEKIDSKLELPGKVGKPEGEKKGGDETKPEQA
jgi:hypothetical protein